MKEICSPILTAVVAASFTGCALNPLAEDNLSKRENSELISHDISQPSAIEINAKFEKTDANKDGVVSKQEAEKLSWLLAIFDSCDTDRDGTLNWNEFVGAMKSGRNARS